MQVFDRSQRMQILKANPDRDTINILHDLKQWENLFANCDSERTTWFKHDMQLMRIGMDTPLPAWQFYNDRRSSTPLWQIAICLTDSPGARVERDRDTWLLEAGQGVIYNVEQRFRIVGSRENHSVFLVGTLYQHASDD